MCGKTPFFSAAQILQRVFLVWHQMNHPRFFSDVFWWVMI
jgi:hypothetical protein